MSDFGLTQINSSSMDETIYRLTQGEINLKIGRFLLMYLVNIIYNKNLVSNYSM